MIANQVKQGRLLDSPDKSKWKTYCWKGSHHKCKNVYKSQRTDNCECPCHNNNEM